MGSPQTREDDATAAMTLAGHCHAQSLANPGHPALVVGEITVSYGELAAHACQLANWLQARRVQRLGILASRTIDAYIGILAAHWIGIAYVPLSPRASGAYLGKLVQHAAVDALLVDPAQQPDWHGELPLIASLHPAIPLVTRSGVATRETIAATPVTQAMPVTPSSTALAYIIFTSGSTGEPKGVPVPFSHLQSFMHTVAGRYPLTSRDRVSQFSALTFDVSLFDMSLAWPSGATLYVVPEPEILNPAPFIVRQQLTVWLSVPTVITILQQLHLLKPALFSTLKYSLFTGEALLYSQADAWQAAAPTSQLENLYGPTEGTIDCLAQVYDAVCQARRETDTVPIGKPFVTMRAALLDEQGSVLPPGSKGELVIAGPQVVSGYLRDTVRTRAAFIRLPDAGDVVWYKTGDYCAQAADGIFTYLSRRDNQCKILGKRIELEAIESQLRQITGVDAVVAMALQPRAQRLPQLVAVIGREQVDAAPLQAALRERLPEYMIPERIYAWPALPYNANGKLDRQQLQADLIHTFYSES